MKSNKSAASCGLSLTALGIVQLIIRTIGVDNISVWTIVPFLAIACTATIIALYQNRKKGPGVRYSTILGGLLILIAILGATTVILARSYNRIWEQYKYPLVISELLCFYGLVAFIAFVRPPKVKRR